MRKDRRVVMACSLAASRFVLAYRETREGTISEERKARRGMMRDEREVREGMIRDEVRI
jgi:hypothetical protein